MVWCRQATSHYLSGRANVDPDLCHHMASLGHNELRDSMEHWNGKDHVDFFSSLAAHGVVMKAFSTASDEIVVDMTTFLFPWRHAVCTVINDDVMTWKHFPRWRPFGRGIHQSLIPLSKDQWYGALMFSLMLAWINSRTSSQVVSDLIDYDAHVTSI